MKRKTLPIGNTIASIGIYSTVLLASSYGDFSPASTCAMFMFAVVVVNSYNNRDVILPALQNFWESTSNKNDTTNESGSASLKCD